MNNFQKIFSAVIIFGLLGLGACVSSQPDKRNDISTDGGGTGW